MHACSKGLCLELEESKTMAMETTILGKFKNENISGMLVAWKTLLVKPFLNHF
jgi:hypothetical protein